VTVLAYLASTEDAYVRDFRARVVALPPGGVVLDRTYFYPTGGGQPSDLGTIVPPNGTRLNVVDVGRSGASVVHRIRGPAEAVRTLQAGVEVEGSIDWERRHRHMRLHTAQHLLSARVFARTGLRTRRAAFSGTQATLDLDGVLDPELLGALSSDLASAAASPRPVTIRQVPRAEWDRNPLSARSGLVPLAPGIDPVRVIDIEGLDLCPCGGTHLRSTGEIGAVELRAPTALPDGGSRLAFTLGPPGPAARPG
jgi:misacylated tRNA(Ala) deacylase